jgi:hypothetical protein
MVTIKTKVAKSIINDRWNKVTEAEIYLTIERLEENINHVIASGFYFYKVPTEDKEVFNDVVLTSFNTRYSWEQISQVEQLLPELKTKNSYFEATLQRMREFAIFQQQMESSRNFGILFEEWDL